MCGSGVCTSVSEVIIPDTVTEIGEYAFADCEGLVSVTIPGSVNKIGQKVFDGCSNLTIITTAGSTAEQYAAAENIAYILK